jgi:hypothetical protein
MIVDFAQARERVEVAAKKQLAETLLTVTYGADGKLAVVLNREAARRFDRAFGDGESQGLHSAVSAELQETLRATGERADVLRKVV